jgi:osomolarity two-component system response regulator SKN7
MDIIMPLFDGVSATACIRMASPRIPIIAMTSAIRQEDIATYFQWGQYYSKIITSHCCRSLTVNRDE